MAIAAPDPQHCSAEGDKNEHAGERGRDRPQMTHLPCEEADEQGAQCGEGREHMVVFRLG